jgi:tryptophan-rich sensory protein
MNTEQLTEYLPIILPLLLIQLTLAFISIRDILRQERYRFGNRPMWIVIALFVNIVGPILYFTLGKSDT